GDRRPGSDADSGTPRHARRAPPDLHLASATHPATGRPKDGRRSMARDSRGKSLIRPTMRMLGSALDNLRRAMAGIPRPDGRSAPPWSGPILLLCLGFVFTESAWLSALRGQESVESEMRHARADGYYESLLREPAADRDRPAADRGPAVAVRPPIG